MKITVFVEWKCVKLLAPLCYDISIGKDMSTKPHDVVVKRSCARGAETLEYCQC